MYKWKNASSFSLSLFLVLSFFLFVKSIFCFWFSLSFIVAIFVGVGNNVGGRDAIGGEHRLESVFHSTLTSIIPCILERILIYLNLNFNSLLS